MFNHSNQLKIRYPLLSFIVAITFLILPSIVSAQDTITLQLKWKHQFQFAGYYAAIENGYYRDAGLNVVLREATANEEPADVVLRGDAEFGISTSDLILQRSKNHPVVVLAPIFQHSALVFLVTKQSGISSIHDLKDKSIMIEPHAADLLAYLEYEGIDQQHITQVPHTFAPTSLINGQVQALSAYETDEPYVLQKSNVDYLIFTPRAAGIDFYGDTIFTTEQQIKNHPDRVKKFLQASLKGWAYALDHPEEIVDLILANYSQRHTRDHLLFEAEKTKRLILPDVVELGYNNPGRWRHIANTYASLGMMEPNIALDAFLYEQNPIPDLSRYYAALGISFGVISILSFVLVRFSRLNAQIRKQAQSLEIAMGEIKELRGIIPICANCKKVRDDEGYWDQVEHYIEAHTNAEFSHGICIECIRELYPDYYERHKDKYPDPPPSPHKHG